MCVAAKCQYLRILSGTVRSYAATRNVQPGRGHHHTLQLITLVHQKQHSLSWTDNKQEIEQPKNKEDY